MWVTVLPLAVLPLWQVSQVPVPTALAGEWVNLTPLDQLVVDEWQLSQLPVTVACVAVAGLEVKPYVPVKWHDEHWVLMETLL
jgi:hypothetical protein